MTTLLRAFIFILFIPLAVFGEEDNTAYELSIDDLRRRIQNEAPGEIMSFNIDDSEVSLFLTGSWKGEFQLNPGYFWSPYASGFASSNTPFFMQEADLTLALWINDRWFVEANFLDDSSRNTYRAGFQGLPGDILQYAGIGNTGLDFPSFPYMDLGGDSSSSFGFYSRFGNDNLHIHALLRYDSASREERTFSGSRERTYSYIQPQNSIRGVSFVLPDTDIDSQVTVYIEDDKGTIMDLSGRRWKLALSTEYAFSAALGLLELNIRPNGMVAVSYSKSGNDRSWAASMGHYDGSSYGYLTEIQNWFDKSREKIKLENYPQPGNGRGYSARPGEVIFGSAPALVVYERGTFSAFERRSRYDAPSSSSEYAAIIRVSDGKEISGFELVPFETSGSSADLLTFSSAVSQRGIYELLGANTYTRRDPKSIWPLAKDYPEIYLPPSGVFSGDINLRFTNFSGTNGYFIGTDAVPGSVQVWRSGIQDSNFHYNPSSGEVVISGAVGHNELIRITYLKRSEETRLGSIAAGLGVIYNNTGAFSAQAALGVRMNISDNAYTEEENSSHGNAGLSAKAAWDYDFLKAHITGGVFLEQSDSTGLYRAAGMEGNEIVLSLPPESSFISNPPSSLVSSGLGLETRADLIYRNYYNNSVLGSNLMTIETNAPFVTGINRPYPVLDPQLGNRQLLTAEFDLDRANNWTGFQSPVNNFKEIISRASEIEIPFRLYGFSQTANTNIKLIIQIGSLSGKDFSFTENTELIWEKILYQDSESFNSDAQIARFTLADEDRLKLSDAGFLRLLVVYEGSDSMQGRVLLAGPVVKGASFRPVIFDGNVIRHVDNVRAAETMDMGASLADAYPDISNRLHSLKERQRALRIDWENMERAVSAGVDTRLGQLPLSDYRELSFFVKLNNDRLSANNETLRFIAGVGPDSIGENLLEASVPLRFLRIGQWSKVTVRYQGNNTGISVDGNPVPGSFSYNPQKISFNNSEKKTVYAAILISPGDSSASLADGTIFIDEIILEDSILALRMNLGAGISYKRAGDIVSINNFDVLSDFFVSAALESEAGRGTDSDDSRFRAGIVSRTGMGISVFGFKISGNMAFTAAEDMFLWSADHAVTRTIGSFSVKESFSASPGDNTSFHNFNVSYLSNFHTKLETDARYDFSRLRQNWKFDIGYTPKNVNIPSIMLKTDALWTKKDQINEEQNYADLWLNSWSKLIPDNGYGADTRRAGAQIVMTQRTRPLGAIITVDGNSFFSDANSVTRIENSAFLDIPAAVNRLFLNFRTGRTFRQHLDYSGENILDDGIVFFDSVNNSSAFWKTIPVYAVFAPDLNNAMDTHVLSSQFYSSQFVSFNEHFSVRVNLPSMYNLISFFVPARINLRLDRTIEQKMDTRADLLNIGGSLGFSSINMFGVMGYSPVFKFYQSDEFSHAIETVFIIPKDEEIQWRVQSVLSAGFRGFSGGLINFVNTISLRNTGYWTESFTAFWEIPAEKSLLSFFYNWIVKASEKQNAWLNLSSLLNSNYEQLRRESLELIIDKSSDYLRWSLTAGHEQIIRILGRLNLTGFVKLKIGKDFYNDIFILEALLGTSIRISF